MRRDKRVFELEEEYHAEQYLTLLFDVNSGEQADSLRAVRAAFGAATEIEALNERVYALHICPGYPSRPCDGRARRPTT